jgi:response regulator RpfG family c-di-GMP phosphodiesterase
MSIRTQIERVVPHKSLVGPSATSEPVPEILVVDDEPDILSTLQDALPLYFDDAVVHIARNGDEARQRLLAQAVDVIISDERMPGISGVELLAWAKEARPDCVRILMTAFHDPLVKQRAVEEAHVDDFIPKPFRLPHLAARVQSLVSSRDRNN